MVLQNGTLQDEIDRLKKKDEFIPEETILKLFLSVCRGLYAMHTCPSGPVAHRDIKV